VRSLSARLSQGIQELRPLLQQALLLLRLIAQQDVRHPNGLYKHIPDSARSGIPLLLRMGGVGLLPFGECAEPAHAAAMVSAASAFLTKNDPSLDPLSDNRSQRKSGVEIFLSRRSDLQKQSQQHHPPLSQLDRNWLSTMPYNLRSSMPDNKLAAGLHNRT
jgi:hypothetical protein